MGYRLRFTETLGDMADYGPDLQLRAHCGSCGTWPRITVEEYAQAYGWEFSFWDWIEACEGCGKPLTFLSSPGPTTPMLPMRTEEGMRRILQMAIGDEKARQPG